MVASINLASLGLLDSDSAVSLNILSLGFLDAAITVVDDRDDNDAVAVVHPVRQRSEMDIMMDEQERMLLRHIPDLARLLL